uniref:Uncharacterized protein n=1 Tax=Rhizophora mucronata TaxID=61149 RepID=A0A2P2N2I8_RHIMU
MRYRLIETTTKMHAIAKDVKFSIYCKFHSVNSSTEIKSTLCWHDCYNYKNSRTLRS